MKKNILRIDTSDNLITRIELNSNSTGEKRKVPNDQNVLELIERALEKQKLKLEDIDSIEINTGPGSFTGLRVGAAIANALSFAGSIRVNGKKLGDIITPVYS